MSIEVAIQAFTIFDRCLGCDWTSIPFPPLRKQAKPKGVLHTEDQQHRSAGEDGWGQTTVR